MKNFRIVLEVFKNINLVKEIKVDKILSIKHILNNFHFNDLRVNLNSNPNIEVIDYDIVLKQNTYRSILKIHFY